MHCSFYNICIVAAIPNHLDTIGIFVLILQELAHTPAERPVHNARARHRQTFLLIPYASS